MSAVEWVRAAWHDVKLDQKVRVVDGPGTIEGRVQHVARGELLPTSLLIKFSETASTRVYRNDSSALFVEASPKPPLPTEPGWYSVDSTGSPYSRLLRRTHHLMEMVPSDQTHDGLYTAERLAELALSENRLTRLEPAAVTAKAVLDRVREEYESSPPKFMTTCLDRVAEYFGVTL